MQSREKGNEDITKGKLHGRGGKGNKQPFLITKKSKKGGSAITNENLGVSGEQRKRALASLDFNRSHERNEVCWTTESRRKRKGIYLKELGRLHVELGRERR